MRNIIITAISCLLFAVQALAAGDDAAIYFNAGTEKYLQGNFTEAVENLEKARKLEPANTKIREFIVKILIEATTQGHLTRNYRQAFEYIKKAREMAPENSKVQELYQLTSEMLTPTQEKVLPRNKTLSSATGEIRRDIPAGEQNSGAPAQSSAPKTARPMRAATTASSPARPQALERIPVFYIRIMLAAIAAGMIILPVTIIIAAVKTAALSKATTALKELDANLHKLSGENAEIKIELEKTKERIKFEHQNAEQYRRELKERGQREDERIHMELELRTKEAEERIRKEIAENNAKKGGSREAFLHQQQEKFLQYLGSSAENDDVSSPALESSRERIAVMAENLYEYAPGAALDFLGKMAVNPNPLIRANVMLALARIGRPETVEMLLKLHGDADYRVKREALKNLKLLNQKIAAQTLSLSPGISLKVSTLLEEEKKKGEWIL